MCHTYLHRSIKEDCCTQKLTHLHIHVHVLARMDYSNRTTRSIHRLTELKPGDHIQVPGNRSSGIRSTQNSDSDNERRDCNRDTHHLLVIKVIDELHVQVIHKVTNEGAREEVKCYTPRDITVLDYTSLCMGEEAIRRARERIGNEYSQSWNNCEDFICKVRTDMEADEQLPKIIRDAASIAQEGRVPVEVMGGGLIGAGIGTFIVPVVGTLVGGAVGIGVGYAVKLMRQRNDRR